MSVPPDITITAGGHDAHDHRQHDPKKHKQEHIAMLNRA